MTYVLEVLSPIPELRAEMGDFLIIEPHADEAAGESVATVVRGVTRDQLPAALFASTSGALRLVDPPLSTQSAADILRSCVLQEV